jgi:hypothetical protein
MSIVNDSTFKLVELDSRTRVSLRGLVADGQSRFRAEVLDDGTIMLSPAIVLTAREAELLANPERAESIRAGLDDVRSGRVSVLDLDALED